MPVKVTVPTFIYELVATPVDVVLIYQSTGISDSSVVDWLPVTGIGQVGKLVLVIFGINSFTGLILIISDSTQSLFETLSLKHETGLTLTLTLP